VFTRVKKLSVWHFGSGTFRVLSYKHVWTYRCSSVDKLYFTSHGSKEYKKTMTTALFTSY